MDLLANFLTEIAWKLVFLKRTAFKSTLIVKSYKTTILPIKK